MTSDLHSASSDQAACQSSTARSMRHVETQWSSVQPNQHVFTHEPALCDDEPRALITVLAVHISSCDVASAGSGTSAIPASSCATVAIRHQVPSRTSPPFYRRISCTRGCRGAGADAGRGSRPEQVAAASQQNTNKRFLSHSHRPTV